MIGMGKPAGRAVAFNKAISFFSKPQNIILLLFGIVLTFSTFGPIVAIINDTFAIHPGTIDAHLTKKTEGYSIVNYIDLFTSRLQSKFMDASWKYGFACYHVLYSRNTLWWDFCIFSDQNKFEV